MLDRICTVEDCERSLRAKGLCGLHYSRKQRGLPLNFTGGNRKPGFVKGCSVEDCPNQFYSKGYCRFHFDRWNKGTNLIRPFGEHDHEVHPIITPAKCSFEGCGRKGAALELCMGHYHQLKAGKELSELRKYCNVVEDQTGRVCTMCFTYKDWDNFYQNNRGKGYKTKCKRCMVAKAAIHQYESDVRHHQRPDWAYEYVEVQNAKTGIS